MKKRIFLSMLALGLTVLAVGSAVFLFAARGRVEGEPLKLLLPILIASSAAALLASVPLAFYLAQSLTRPINRLDPADPRASALYPELRPMVEQLDERNRRVFSQMQELRRRETELSAITDNMSEGLVIMDASGVILTCSKSARKMLDISPEENLPSILSVNRSERFRRIVRGALVGERGEEQLTSGDTVYRIVASPVDNGGVPEGAVLLILDDTEKERREALRREFTSNVSHELKTPLTAISGYAELIERGMAGESCPKFAETIRKEATRLLALVNDILHLSRLDEGATVDSAPVELSALVTEVASRFAPIAEQRHVSISTDAMPATVRGDRALLDEMLSNLVDNAVKYGREGGSVKLRLTQSGEQIRLTVTDDGIGIPGDQLDRVFERFYRVDKSHSRDVGGTGLGLSIVKHAAYLHRARLELDSTLGVGTTVTVIFEDHF